NGQARECRHLSSLSKSFDNLLARKIRPRCGEKRRVTLARSTGVVSMLETMHLLAGTNWILLASAALIFDIPRYTFSLISLALFGWRGKQRNVLPSASVSVIIPTFNGGSGLGRTIGSLH